MVVEISLLSLSSSTASVCANVASCVLGIEDEDELLAVEALDSEESCEPGRVSVNPPAPSTTGVEIPDTKQPGDDDPECACELEAECMPFIENR